MYPAHELPEALWDRIMAVNLKSCFLMTKHCVPELRRRGAESSSTSRASRGRQSMKGVAAYAASKGGILALTRQLAMELRSGQPSGCSPSTRAPSIPP